MRVEAKRFSTRRRIPVIPPRMTESLHVVIEGGRIIMRVQTLWRIVVMLLCAASLPAEESPDPAINGTELYLSNRLAYSGLSSCRYEMSDSGPRKYRMAYSNSMYRVEEYKDGELVSIQCFDGETYAGLGMKELIMRRGTRLRARCRSPNRCSICVFGSMIPCWTTTTAPGFSQRK